MHIPDQCWGNGRTQILWLPWEQQRLDIKNQQPSSIQMCLICSWGQIFSQQHETFLHWRGGGKWVGRRKGNEEETKHLSPLPCLWERCTQACTDTQARISSWKLPDACLAVCLPLNDMSSVSSNCLQLASSNATTFLTATQTITFLFSTMWGHHTPSETLRGVIPPQASSERAWQWFIMRLVVTSFQYP